MANTPSFNWETPDDTDYVTDGAAAIRTLGNSIDASMTDLKGGTTGQILSKTSATDMDFTWVSPNPGDITGVTATSPLTGGGTSGDVTIGIATSAVVPSQTGNSGKYLTTDGTNSSWGTISAGGWTQLASGTLSGLSVSLTSISQDYRNLHLVITGAYRNSSGSYILVRINSNTNNQYYSTWSGSATTVTIGSATNYWQLVNGANDINTTANDYSRIWTFYDYTSSARRIVASYGSEPVSGYNMNNMHRLDDTAAVSSIQLSIPSGTFGGGSYKLYGEK